MSIGGLKMKKYLLFLMFLGCLSVNLQAQSKQPAKPLITDHWVGTWATAQQIPVKEFMPYNNNLTNRSVRQVVKVSIGGNIIRLKISNELSSQPLDIRSVYVAYTTDDFAIYTKSAKYFKFNKNYTVTVPAGQAVWSDGLLFDLRPLSRLSITINYIKVPRIATVYMGSSTTSYILQGVCSY